MNDETFGPVIDQFKSHQLDFISHVMRIDGNRPDFHRGLIPFLTIQEAARAVRVTFERLKIHLADADFNSLQFRYTKKLISVLEAKLPYQLYPEEESTVMQLSSVELSKAFKRRFNLVFYMTGNPEFGKPMARFEMTGPNMWKVTTKKGFLDDLTTKLAETYR